MTAMQEDLVLYGDGVQVAGAHADEGVLRRLDHPREQCAMLLPCRFGAPQPLLRRMQELLPRMRADSEAEQRLIITLLQPVGPAVLLVSPTDWKIGDRIQLVVDNRAIADGRADNLIAAAGERIEQPLEMSVFESEFASKLSYGLLSRAKPIAKGVPPNNPDHHQVAFF